MKKCMSVKIYSKSMYLSIPLEPFIVEWGKTKDYIHHSTALHCVGSNSIFLYEMDRRLYQKFRTRLPARAEL